MFQKEWHFQMLTSLSFTKITNFAWIMVYKMYLLRKKRLMITVSSYIDLLIHCILNSWYIDIMTDISQLSSEIRLSSFCEQQWLVGTNMTIALIKMLTAITNVIIVFVSFPNKFSGLTSVPTKSYRQKHFTVKKKLWRFSNHRETLAILNISWV